MEYTELRNELVFYIPSKTKQGEYIGRTSINIMIDEIAQYCNVEGFTLTNSVGYWKGNKEDIIQMAVNTKTAESKENILALAKYIKLSLRQDSVAIKVNGVLRIYS